MKFRERGTLGVAMLAVIGAIFALGLLIHTASAKSADAVRMEFAKGM